MAIILLTEQDMGITLSPSKNFALPVSPKTIRRNETKL